ncbi:MAG: hypothetical protein ACRDRP_09850 [Pseudonocardiaceae bacterium]
MGLKNHPLGSNVDLRDTEQLRDDVAPRRQVSACPKGHPLPTLPTKWFDGVTWHDGSAACRHCYEAGTAMDQTKAAVS